MNEAFGRAYAWEHDAAILGLLDEFSGFRNEIRSSLEKALANALRRADEKCKNHDLTQLNRLLSIERNAQLLGLELPSPSPLERFVRCAHFELDFSFEASTVKISDIGPAHTEERTSLRVNAERIPIAPGENFRMNGEGSLNLENWQYREDVTVSAGGRTTSCSRVGLPGHVDRSSPRAPQVRRADRRRRAGDALARPGRRGHTGRRRVQPRAIRAGVLPPGVTGITCTRRRRRPRDGT